MVKTRPRVAAKILKQKAGLWGHTENSKLQKLFIQRSNRGGVDSKNLNASHIRSVLEEHFPDRVYNNFAPLFRAKARKFNLNQELEGARQTRGKNCYHFFTEIPLYSFVIAHKNCHK